ncbi:MAG: alpha/beta hydrolase [Tidjanibacter sp.]|nr:alpha/beta hydrolase [Tidjanibacter sp.]
MKRIILLFLTLILALGISAQEVVEKQAYTFAHRGEKELKIDLYQTSPEVQPCLVYIFGGAFVTGVRDEPEVVEVYEYFARRGWKVAAIDYRLGLVPLIEEPEVDRSLLDFRAMLIDAIDIAAQDLLEATAYLVYNAEQLGVDPARIVTLGSSAGAITACQAEWEICNGGDSAALLPADFNYAGVISMAGAICEATRKLEWKRKPCPMMLFHGDADRNVPYGTQSLFGVRLFGSESIAESLKRHGAPYWFYDAYNVDHSLSWRPMYFLRNEMERFLERMVFGGEPLQIHQVVDDKSLPDLESDFGMKVYIEANFTPEIPRGVEAAEY